MNIKEFFKPTRKKILLLILFIIIFNILPIIPCLKLHIQDDLNPPNDVFISLQKPPKQWSFCILIGRGMLIGPIMQYLGLSKPIDQYIALFVVFIISYFLSCLIISIYKKN